MFHAPIFLTFQSPKKKSGPAMEQLDPLHPSYEMMKSFWSVAMLVVHVFWTLTQAPNHDAHVCIYIYIQPYPLMDSQSDIVSKSHRLSPCLLVNMPYPLL